MKISRTNAYNIEIPRNIDETKSGMWTFMRFDPCYFIKTKLANSYKDFASLKDITYDNCTWNKFARACNKCNGYKKRRI